MRNASAAGITVPTSAPTPRTRRSAGAALPTSSAPARSASMLKWFGLSALIIVLDQLTKHWVMQAFAVHEVKEITSFFNMLLVFNKGAAFSLLADAGGWQRALFTGIAIV